ncbi:MAG: hypothetical protein JWN98_1008 [Abditibacteriota bacterium]|nr:hypothetical protein [Abditibacteriota bacterium]
MNDSFDVVVIGAGAAGMMAAIAAAQIRLEGRAAKVLLLDGREKIGAKILVSGGTRCNVTNEWVHPSRFHTESDPYRAAAFKGDGLRSFVGRVLRAFSTEQTHRFFDSIGVQLKLEETGKYFPVTDSARTVLNALLRAVDDAGAQLRTGMRVQNIKKTEAGYCLDVQSSGGEEAIEARSVIVCTGGLALPKSGSDGAGYVWAKQFGHTIVRTTPALTPLLSGANAHTHLSGITLPVRLKLGVAPSLAPAASQVHAKGNAEKNNAQSTLAQYDGSFLFTHWGYSGPVALNISRHVARDTTPEARVSMRLLPEVEEGAEGRYWQEFVRVHSKKNLPNALSEILPRRVAETIAKYAVGDAMQSTLVGKLSNEQNRRAREQLLDAPLAISAVADYVKAETTAGGVSLAEIEPATMMSFLEPGLFFAGEVCDVDGWLGGYNFQWAWSSGVVAGRAAARLALRSEIKIGAKWNDLA